ncbi:MAG: NAD(P)/FAD-dependent oxidoreductase [Clostridia bacterium]|nr:NAD(P)/FAD-dependent oxidoreductase [Clostridia bacterium]
MRYDVVIAGAGVIGGMIARELSKYKLSVCLLEKKRDVSGGASKANTGIIHGGYDPVPGTLKAKMNTLGTPKLYEAAKMLNVPFKQNGSMICAFGKEEEPEIYNLYERGLINQTPDMKILTGDEARAIEPALSEEVTLVLHVPSAGIICPYKLTIAAVGNAMDNGVDFLRNFEVAHVEKKDGDFIVTNPAGRAVTGRYFLNCAGCYSDHVAELAGDCDFKIIPRSGEYLLLDKTQGGTLKHTIFQVPTNEGKGILVTPTVDGNLMAGPTALAVASPQNKENTYAGLQTVITLSKKSIPGVDFSQTITNFTGIRSSVKDGDFIIRASEKVEGLVHVAAIDSPGLTSCVAIAEYVVDILREIGLATEPKADWNGCREDTEFFRHMSDEEKDAYIKEHPEYGKIVCRCETVTEGEIRDAIRRNPPAVDVDGVKRRTRSGMGRCQGGFCGPYVMELIAEESGIPMEDITKKGYDSVMVKGRL